MIVRIRHSVAAAAKSGGYVYYLDETGVPDYETFRAVRLLYRV